MAREVVADIDFDNSGSARLRMMDADLGRLQRGSTTAARTLEHEWSRAGSSFLKQMFSMRAAAVAFLGGFTLAGVISSLAALTKEVITGTDWWKKFSAAATDAFNSLVKGETVMQRVGRHMAEAFQGTGVTSPFEMTKQVEKLLKLRRDIFEAQGQIMGQPGEAEAQELLRIKLIQIRDELLKIQKESGLTAEQFQRLFRMTQPIENAGPAQRVDEGGFLEPLRKAPEVIKKAVRVAEDEWFVMLSDTGIPVMENLGKETEGWNDNLITITEETLPEVSRSMRLLIQDVEDAARTYERFSEVASAGFEAIAAAELAGVVSQNTAARIRMGILAIESILKGKIEVAEAIAAAARYDFGSAALHGTAAGLYFAAAAFYGRGAILGQAGGGAASAVAAAGTREQPRERVINVYLPNAVVLGGNRSQVGRDLADYLRQAERGNG